MSEGDRQQTSRLVAKYSLAKIRRSAFASAYRIPHNDFHQQAIDEYN
jgi:hypothetical protein